MKNITAIISAFLLPTVSFAHGYMMNSFDGGWGYNNFDAAGSMFGMLLVIPFIGVIVAIAVFIFWVMMLIDVIKHTSEKTKLVWVVVIIFTHVIGALIYYFVEKRPRMKSSHKE